VAIKLCITTHQVLAFLVLLPLVDVDGASRLSLPVGFFLQLIFIVNNVVHKLNYLLRTLVKQVALFVVQGVFLWKVLFVVACCEIFLQSRCSFFCQHALQDAEVNV
jgi:hypothetical protein